MKYHFRIHEETKGYWGESIELKGCMSQGETLEELKKNLKEALDLYLDEPEDSQLVLPVPRRKASQKGTIEIVVDPRIALAILLRNERLKKRWSQQETAQKAGMPLYSYQRLESSKTANPEWGTLAKLRRLFPHLNLNLAV